MPLYSPIEIFNLKLNSIPSIYLKELAKKLGTELGKRKTETIKQIIKKQPKEVVIDEFIKEKYLLKIKERRLLITDEELKEELKKVTNFSWGVIQGQLDQKIQTEYARKLVRYEELVRSVKAKLHHEITNYVICSWFNHWTTVLIEEHISKHPRVIPTLKSIKGIDLFFDGQPFDLKVTYLPRNYNIDEAMKNPKELIIWMYENQGAQRFGADNRLFVILLDPDDPEKSWELKRNFDLIFKKIDKFFEKEKVSLEDEIIFSFKKKTYTAISKLLMITK